MGGMSSQLDSLSGQIWSWCYDRNIILTAQYIPGKENFSADMMSRNFHDTTEWKLKSEIYLRLCKHFNYEPTIDLFASRLNNQMVPFVSWSFDPQALYTNAFSLSWSNFIPYIFPPFNLITRIIHKIIADNVEKAMIVVPFWPTQNWFPLLMSVLISLPARLPQHNDLLVMPHSGEFHPLRKKLRLVGCIVSGRDCYVQDFHQNQLTLFSSHGNQEQSSNMNSHGESTFFGVVKGKSIHFTRLRL